MINRWAGLAILIIVFILFFGIFLYKIYLKHISFIYFVFPILIIFGYFITYTNTTPDKFVKCITNEGLQCVITGEVDDVRKSGYGYKIFIKNSSVKFYDAEFNDIVCKTTDGIIYADEKFNKGDIIKVYGNAKLFDNSDNPGEFDLKMYYETLKIYYRIYPDKINLIKSNANPVYNLADQISDMLEQTFYKITDDASASVFSAMLLGNKDYLDEEISDLFSACGIGHILAISGLHISIIGMGIYKIIRRCGCGYISAMITSGAMIIFYGIMTGNGTSTVRALIMFILSVYANVAGRTYDLVSAAALAAFVMLVDSPLLIYNSGFLLSFGAIAGIGIINPVLQKLIKKRNKLKDAFVSGISIQLATIPILMYSYFQIPIYSVLLNLIVVPLMTVVMISALFACILGSVYEAAGKICIGPGVYILKAYEYLCNICLELPNAVWVSGRPESWQIALYYIVLGITLYIIYNFENKGGVIGVVLALLFISVRIRSDFQVYFLDVGQGDCIFIRCGDCTILVDGGSSDEKTLYEYTLEPFLLSKGVSKLDYAIVTHPDNDHISGLKALLKEDIIDVEILLMPEIQNDDAYWELFDIAKKSGTNVQNIHSNMILEVQGMTVKCLHPADGFVASDRNDYSTVIGVEYQDFTMLLTGDISAEVEKKILKGIEVFQNVDILKAAHHGSKYSNSSEFLEVLNPKTVVVSCGVNNDYGHPHMEALRRFEAVGANILITAEEECVFFTKGAIKCFL